MTQKKKQSEYTLVWNFFSSRFKDPFKSVAFVIYFITVIFVVGLSANFISLYSTYNTDNDIDYNNISLSLVGYGVVLLCSSAIELIFISFDQEEEKKFVRIKNGISMIGISSVLIGLILSVIIYFTTEVWIKFSLSVIITIGSLLLWWVSNARSLSVLKVLNTPDSDDTTGGQPNKSSLEGEIPKDYIS